MLKNTLKIQLHTGVVKRTSQLLPYLHQEPIILKAYIKCSRILFNIKRSYGYTQFHKDNFEINKYVTELFYPLIFVTRRGFHSNIITDT